jgi:hypothetical protein
MQHMLGEASSASALSGEGNRFRLEIKKFLATVWAA